jgi:hypothetical protein
MLAAKVFLRVTSYLVTHTFPLFSPQFREPSL